jgi:hypothetical protein
MFSKMEFIEEISLSFFGDHEKFSTANPWVPNLLDWPTEEADTE